MTPMNFHDAIRAAGLTPPDVIEPGRFYRFNGDGKRNGNTAGWCKLFADGEGGIFGDWSSGLSRQWQASRAEPITHAERDAWRKRIEEARREAEAEREQQQAEAANTAASIWQAATPASEHGYLSRKRIEPHGARIHDTALVIPMRADGAICSLQFIGPDGDKRFLKGGRTAGAYFSIGKPDGVLCIAEGFATGASIHEATGHAVAVAFNAGNLESVAKAMQAEFSDQRLIVCADDDFRTKGNPGMTQAAAAARSVGGALAVPDFGADRPEGATDFNDLAVICGAEAVQRAIANAGEPPRGEPQPGGSDAPVGESEGLLATVARLAGLHPLEYEQAREAQAQRLGVRVAALDKEVGNARRAKQEEGGKAAMFPTVEPCPEPVDGADLLDDLVDTIHRFIVCERHTAITAALWIVFTWVIGRVQVAPLAVITAPEKRCGKSQLLTLIGRLSRRPAWASNISPATVFRMVEAHCPTLLIDEADSFFKENEELRGVINSGHTRQLAYVWRTVGDDHEPRRFSTWGAKAISGIGHLSETLMDRAVILELRRKLPSEKVQRLRHAEPGLFESLASRLARFADDAGMTLEQARPDLPEALNDRAQDNWEPLLAIADYAGRHWPRYARDAALKLSGAEQESMSLSAELLADIREVFDHKKVDRISTADLLQALTADDLNPWATYNRGKPMAPRQLARRLDEYNVKSRDIRFGHDGIRKGYDREQFDDVFTRYLPLSNTPATSATALQPSNHGHFDVADTLQRCGNKLLSATPKTAPDKACSVVADKSVVSGGGMVEVEI